MTTGERIKTIRKAAKLTQKELGAKLGVTYQTVAQWENDLRNPKMETLERIADALNAPLSDICSKDLLKNYEILKRGQENSQKKMQETRYALEQLALALRQQEAIKVLGGKRIERIVYALDKMNDKGQKKAVERVEELAEIPRYRRQEPAEASPASPKGTDTPTAQDAPEGTEEGG